MTFLLTSHDFNRDTIFTLIKKMKKIYQTPDQFKKPIKIDGYYVLKSLLPHGLKNKLNHSNMQSQIFKSLSY